MKKHKGQSVVEFALVLPLFLFMLEDFKMVVLIIEETGMDIYSSQSPVNLLSEPTTK